MGSMSDAILQRIDSHLERGNELMQLNRTAFERNTEAFERNREAFDRNSEVFERVVEVLGRHEEVLDGVREDHEDTRVFVRDITRRNELVTQQVVRELQDLRRESQAQRKALFQIFDRLQGDG